MKRVANVLSTSGMNLETQIFREQQLTSTITYLEVLSREAAIAIASVGAERLQPENLKDRSPFEALHKYLEITWDTEFPDADVWQRLKDYRQLRNELVHVRRVNHGQQAPAFRIPGVVFHQPSKWLLTADFWPSLKTLAEDYTSHLIGTIIRTGRISMGRDFVAKYGGATDPKT